MGGVGWGAVHLFIHTTAPPPTYTYLAHLHEHTLAHWLAHVLKRARLRGCVCVRHWLVCSLARFEVSPLPAPPLPPPSSSSLSPISASSSTPCSANPPPPPPPIPVFQVKGGGVLSEPISPSVCPRQTASTWAARSCHSALKAFRVFETSNQVEARRA